MTTRLGLYNDALLACSERSLASLTENREPRFLLDQIWNNNGVRGCLEEGQWYFAMRTVQLDYDPGIEPDFGYQRAFDKPSDWVRTCGVCTDEWFTNPLTRYNDEAGYWYSDEATIYVRYVSDDIAYGNNLALWPQSFADFVAIHFASKIVKKLTNSDEKFEEMMRLRQKSKLEAKSKAAMADATQFPAQGSWTRARMYGSYGRDGGNRGGDLY